MNLLTFILSCALLALSVLAQSSTDAPITENNPTKATFQAVLQENKPVQGQITGVSNDNGTGVAFNINFFDFPDASAGPFLYHIHVLPVPQDGNCTGTLGHLTPYGRNDTPPCDATQPSTCQPGDLSGKHGTIADTAREKNFQLTYLDLYLSTDPQSPAFFGNRSVVVHAANAMGHKPLEARAARLQQPHTLEAQFRCWLPGAGLGFAAVVIVGAMDML
ncbi:Cell surface superoxide dismutase [Cu-Zn] 4 [Exophiala xenobiotica]|nr:Cell surface superoxide dismutase [Cu-Zn] 4 [Exophiala xenobiotica]KAK5390169.1 Cell surface superoxide dismutase [Cu-Zn] 4 [Exophiala xenobiotica]KAK5403387.1 Cell surface superoxide dismutase [Cu-Zn] 4 [Exophiala xenobiotica]KAK5422875.1 Cell surface superoxide dismutase [Cu-Zn] 4 [Exophiala xenobiotica]KAK5431728.1 Cell surface superoxide dismutase [Cu-Zn] 4 [Exophiala xenobiotica]